MVDSETFSFFDQSLLDALHYPGPSFASQALISRKIFNSVTAAYLRNSRDAVRGNGVQNTAVRFYSIDLGAGPRQMT